MNHSVQKNLSFGFWEIFPGYKFSELGVLGASWETLRSGLLLCPLSLVQVTQQIWEYLDR